MYLVDASTFLLMLPFIFLLPEGVLKPLGFSFFFCTNKRKTKQKENSPATFPKLKLVRFS